MSERKNGGKTWVCLLKPLDRFNRPIEDVRVYAEATAVG